MTTLVGEELFDYLGHLDERLVKLSSEQEQDSSEHLSYSQFREILGAEAKFLREYYSSNGSATLSFMGNGLPSAESLIPDLEAMCKLWGKGADFGSIPERFDRELSYSIQEFQNYKAVSREEWDKEIECYDGETSKKTSFSVSQGEDDRFELILGEDYFVNGIDKLSSEFPILSRRIRTRYQVAFNRIFSDSEERLLLLEKSKVLGNSDTQIEKPDQSMLEVSLEGVRYISTNFWESSTTGVSKTAYYAYVAGRYTLDSILRLPTRMRKLGYGDPLEGDCRPVGTFVLGLFGNVAVQANLWATDTSLGLTSSVLLGTTNLVSGMYELGRYVRNKKEDAGENDDSSGE